MASITNTTTNESVHDNCTKPGLVPLEPRQRCLPKALSLVAPNQTLLELNTRFKSMPLMITKRNFRDVKCHNEVRQKLFEIINNVNIDEVYSKYECLATDTEQHDIPYLIALNKLGFITTDSQPGVMDAEESQRAYVAGLMVPDEADDLFDLINRTDVIGIQPRPDQSGHSRLPVTYGYSNCDNEPQSLAGNASKWIKGDSYWPLTYTAMHIGRCDLEDEVTMIPDELKKLPGTQSVKEKLDDWYQYELVYIILVDPQHGRLASEYLYPKVLIPLMRGIREMHDQK